jgi:hypothetical protein
MRACPEEIQPLENLSAVRAGRRTPTPYIHPSLAKRLISRGRRLSHISPRHGPGRPAVCTGVGPTHGAGCVYGAGGDGAGALRGHRDAAALRRVDGRAVARVRHPPRQPRGAPGSGGLGRSPPLKWGGPVGRVVYFGLVAYHISFRVCRVHGSARPSSSRPRRGVAGVRRPEAIAHHGPFWGWCVDSSGIVSGSGLVGPQGPLCIDLPLRSCSPYVYRLCTHPTRI